MKEVTQLVLARRTRMSNFLEYKGESRALAFCTRGCGRWRDGLERREMGGRERRKEVELTKLVLLLPFPNSSTLRLW